MSIYGGFGTFLYGKQIDGRGMSGNTKVEAELFRTPTSGGTSFQAGVWYKVLSEIPVKNGYYGETGKYRYLSATLKKICSNRNGDGCIEVGCIICPTEVKEFQDGSVWFMLDETIACMVVGTDGTVSVEKA